jgi:hypothetical protein
VNNHGTDAAEIDGDDWAIFEREISETAVREGSELVDVS